jgi:hypothetical protein
LSPAQAVGIRGDRITRKATRRRLQAREFSVASSSNASGASTPEAKGLGAKEEVRQDRIKKSVDPRTAHPVPRREILAVGPRLVRPFPLLAHTDLTCTRHWRVVDVNLDPARCTSKCDRRSIMTDIG